MQPFGGLGADEPRGHGVDPDAVRGDLGCQPLAVGRQRSLRRGVGEGAVAQRHLALDRGDVHDRTAPGGDHRRDERPVEPDGGKQVALQLVLPMLVVDRREPAAGRVGAADDVHEDGQWPVRTDAVRDRRRPINGRDVSDDEVRRIREVIRLRRAEVHTCAPALRS